MNWEERTELGCGVKSVQAFSHQCLNHKGQAGSRYIQSNRQEAWTGIYLLVSRRSHSAALAATRALSRYGQCPIHRLDLQLRLIFVTIPLLIPFFTRLLWEAKGTKCPKV